MHELTPMLISFSCLLSSRLLLLPVPLFFLLRISSPRRRFLYPFVSLTPHIFQLRTIPLVEIYR